MFAPPPPPPDDGVVFTEAEIALYSTLSPLPPAPPPDPTNAVADDPRAAQLGRALFADPAFSGPLTVDSELGVVGHEDKVSCATCHFGPALDDPAPFSTGTGVGTRNSLSLVNSAYQRWTNWGGRFAAQWELPIAVVENRAIMNGTRLRVAHRIAAAHRAGYEAVFGSMPPELSDPARFPPDGKPKPAATPEMPAPPDGAWEAMDPIDRATVDQILVNYGKAIAAFLRTIVSRDAPFDRFVAGDRNALDATAQRGLRLFIGKARCVACHNGPLLSDEAFHNITVPVTAVDDGRHKDIPPLLASPFSSATAWSDAPNSGRLAGLTAPPPEETRGQFRTPSLRGVAQSAPYMHNGWFVDLRSVVEHYSWGNGEPASGSRDRLIVPLHLTPEEIEELVAFLGSLTGAPVDPSLAVGTRPTW
jgi:cytochrome c peroxidase